MMAEEAFDGVAHRYAHIASVQKKAGAALLAMLDLAGDERVLDWGCGPGKLTAEVATQCPRGAVLGVDISPEMVAQAQSALSVHPNLKFGCASAEAIEFRDEFDLIISNSAFQWVLEQGGVLGRCFRALKPGGLLAVQMPQTTIFNPLLFGIFAKLR